MPSMRIDAGDLCIREVVVAAPNASLLDVAGLMRTHHVGDVVIIEHCEGRAYPMGIVTDRDIVILGVVDAPDRLGDLIAKDLVTRPLVTIREHESIDSALEIMREKGVRRVPVVDDQGVLVGILSTDDMIELLGDRLQRITGLFARGRQIEQRERP
jgi:CBS domain-containing protein